jgi:5-formyltetrahydrofolate cyclo-ligase
MDIATEKQQLRRMIAVRSLRQKQEDIIAWDQRIHERLMALAIWQTVKTACIYCSKAMEVSTDAIIHRLLSSYRVAIPKVLGDHQLELYIIRSLDETQPGHFGIREPIASCPRIDKDDVDLFIVPGRAFDLHGNRLGHGAYYYDTLLAGVIKPKIGLAYEWQIVNEIPTEPHDIQMDFVVTEDRLIPPP